jgi:endonuclease/exonuclease/phosphatase family metal-dependent hydrolase
MKKLITSVVLLSSLSAFAEKASLKIASLNLQGWIDTSSRRAIIMKDLFGPTGMLNGVSAMITQESIEQEPYSTTDQLAKELGWKSFSQRRVSDNEGLGILYPKGSDVGDILTLQLKSRSSSKDYSRMALTAIIHHPDFGKIRIVNVHLAHEISKNLTRKKQLREVMTWIENLEGSDPSDLIIFGGDFNTGKTDIAYAGEFDILKDSPFRFKLVRATGADYSFKDMKTGRRRLIDHFFISQHSKISFKSLETKIYREITDLRLSDHNLLILNIEMNF